MVKYQKKHMKPELQIVHIRAASMCTFMKLKVHKLFLIQSETCKTTYSYGYLKQFAARQSFSLGNYFTLFKIQAFQFLFSISH